MRNYIKWLKHNWAHTGLVLSVYLTIFLVAFVRNNDNTLFLLLMTIPLYMIHQTEEYIFPGGFAKFFNMDIFRTGRADAPMETEFIFYVNIIYIWILLPLFGILSSVNYTYGLWMSYFFFFAGAAHIVLAVKAKKKYNPGLVVSCLVNIPYGAYLVYYLHNIGLIANPWINVHMLAGLALNLILPVMGVIMYKNYMKKDKAESNI